MEISSTSVAVDIPTVQPVQCVFDKVCIDVAIKGDKANPTKRILDEVSGGFGPKELIAVMGPSGSGKTTMLNALTGVATPTSGTITINGQLFSPATSKRFTALVPQDDYLMPTLTPMEAMMDAATFKANLPPGDALARTEELLTQFGLQECRNVAIGHPEGLKGLSGGQKKRLSVALELMGNPSLLFLDEPTSGLDSVAALSLVRLLKSIAQSGATVIATIHQPSAAAFFHFDRLLLLAKGQACYLGQIPELVPFFSRAGFPCPEYHNPADFAMEVLATTPDTPSTLHELHLKEFTAPAALELVKVESSAAYPASFVRQVRTLLKRNLRALVREPALARARVGSHIIVGLIMGVLYFDVDTSLNGTNERLALLLFSQIFLMLSAVLPTIIVVLPELSVVKKEHRNNWYSVKAYYLAKMIADTPLLLVPAALYLLVMGFMSGLAASDTGCRFGMLYLGLMLATMAAHAWGMVLSCAAPTLSIAIFLVPTSVMPHVLFAGFFKNIESIPWVFRWFSYIDFMRYAWEAMGIAAFRELEVAPPYMNGETFMRMRLDFPHPDMGGYWRSVVIILCFAMVFRLLAYLLLVRRVR